MCFIKKLFSCTILVAFNINMYAQECGNCNFKPSVTIYDLNLPDDAGEDAAQNLLAFSRKALAIVYENNKDCIRFMEKPPATEDPLRPLSLEKNPVFANYLISGYIKKQEGGYLITIQLQTSCSRKSVVVSESFFQLTKDSSSLHNELQQIAKHFSPLIEKIKKFELEERKQNKKFAIAGNHLNLIKLTPAKTRLTAGQQTEFTLYLKDCDGVALPGREIVFTESNTGGGKMSGTIGGTVTPAKVITDAQGKANATFKMTATAGKPAIINAHTVTQTPQNCQGVLFGDAQVGAIPAYKVTVSYIKTVRKDMNMNSDKDRVLMKSGSQSSEDVAYSFSLLHYPVKFPKDSEQIIISAQFPELQNPSGKIIILYNEGYNEYIIKEKPLEASGPFGAVTAKGKEEQQLYFSSAPLPPTASFIFKNNELIFFSGGVEFPEVEDGLSPVSSSFGIEKDNKKYFPVKPKKVSDPNSPYKWVYEFEYNNEEGYSQQGKVFKQGSKEVESATIQIWKSF